jgi:hypothetical protein
MGAGLVRFGVGTAVGGGAGVSGTSVERCAASALAGGVSEGCAGGGWRRSAIGLREAQPLKLTQRRQRTQRALRGKNREWENFLREPECRVEMLRKPALKNTDAREFFKGPPAS